MQATKGSPSKQMERTIIPSSLEKKKLQFIEGFITVPKWEQPTEQLR